MTFDRAAPLLWIAAGAVVTVELLIAGLIFYPRADAAYQAYYIERSTDCWPHDTPAAYVPGTTLSFVYGRGHDFAPNKICGWFYPNARGTWSYGTFSLLRFAFPLTGDPLRLTLAAGAMVTEDDPVQRVEVSINGTLLTTLRFDSPIAGEQSVDIPPDLAPAGADGLDIRFDYPDARPGDELGPNEDPHLRAIRVVALTLSQG